MDYQRVNYLYSGKNKAVPCSQILKKTPTQKQIPSSYRPSAQWDNKTIHCWIN